MNKLCIVLALGLAAPSVWGQANDQAAERAKIANQRIEAEARAREEQERRARIAAERAQTAARESVAPVSEPPPPERRAVPAQAVPATPARSAPAARPEDVDRMLERIRTLGELRDAGYVTDSEFERIKARILDGSL